jgi:hypothetical protein
VQFLNQNGDELNDETYEFTPTSEEVKCHNCNSVAKKARKVTTIIPAT